MACICVTLSVFTGAAGVGARKEFRYLKAVPCSGSYSPGGLHTEYLRSLRVKKDIEFEGDFVKADRDELPSFFFGPLKMIADTCDLDEEKCIIRGTIPVPIRSFYKDDIEASILSAMKKDEEKNLVFDNWNGAVITDRDRGIYDNLKEKLKKFGFGNSQEIQKKLYDSLRTKKQVNAFKSPYHALIASLRRDAGLVVTGLLLEVAESLDTASLSLGAAVVVAKEENWEDWRMTVSNCKTVVKDERRSSEAKIIECYVDEVMGLHCALNIPVVISNNLYDRVSTDGLLGKSDSTEALFMRAPYFENEREAEFWRSQLSKDRAKPAKPVPPLSSITDATQFLKMRVSEKRACLRASGFYALPRPRVGPRMVDAMMIPLLDEEVAYEVLRRLGETRGDFKKASEMQDFESRKHILARQCAEATRKGDDLRAKMLCDELNAVATLSFDPSNPDDEVPAEGFDIEAWYWEQRKRVYSIVA